MTTNPVRRGCPLPDYATAAKDRERDPRFRVNPNQEALLRHDLDENRAWCC